MDETPIRFNYTGSLQTYMVPFGCKRIKVDCVGGTDSGKGGRVQCILSVKSKQSLYIMVGQSSATGYNASDIRTSSDLNSRLIVAGGGGAAGVAANGVAGGNGGGLTGAKGLDNTRCTGGYGGTQNTGGSGANSGTFGLGGARYSGGWDMYGGAGGSGWYGGGSGGTNHKSGHGYYAAGGGGGSSYTNPDLCTEVIHTQGYNSSGNGYIIITPLGK